MQAPEDNSITVVDPHAQAYAENNLNEKSLGTQYIYTTEGQLIPASGDHNSSNMDLSSQHYNTVHVTEAQDIHIQQVDYRYDQQYPDGTVQQVVPLSGTQFVQDQSFAMEQDPFEPQTSQEASSTAQQAYGNEAVPNQPPTTYEYSTTTEAGAASVTEQPLASESDEFASEPVKDNSVEQLVETPENVQTAETNVELAENSSNQAIEIVSDDDDVQENIPEEKVEKPTQDAPTTLEEDQSHIENLKLNPAIEIEDDESSGDVVETVPESKTDEELKTDATKPNAEDVKETEVSVTTVVQEDTDSQEAILSEDDPACVEVNKAPSEQPRITRPRGRKSKTDIPLHILGHDVNKPMENFVNGKTPKPRLGVKVPYRNLTSQIVSKAEIEREIIERGRKKQEEQKELSFARQLTSRLARKIIPGSDDKSKAKSSKVSKKKGKEDTEAREHNEMDVDDNANEESSKDKPKEGIDNNLDLLAILEGDGDSEEIAELDADLQNKESTPTDETNIKNLEREIALQQLQDLPYLSPKTKFLKGSNRFKGYSKELPAPGGSDKVGSPAKSHPFRSPMKSPIKSSFKSNILKMDVESPIKVNMTLKTYSRKRKSTEGVVESIPSPSKKTNVLVSTHEIDLKPRASSPADDPIYVTKSSRVIKKKVIWDPDVRPSKIKGSPVKTDSVTPSKAIHKPVHSKNENKPADLPRKSAADVKAKTDKKVDEKPSPKKAGSAEKRPSPATSKLGQKYKSEVDRLLGDEGAIKMLYDLKKSDNGPEEKRKKTVISVERTFKELAKKANKIKSDLVNTSSTPKTTKSLRKKDSAASPGSTPAPKPTPAAASTPAAPGGISRQKSKDSARSTSPASPAFPFPNEVSYLIRRRSSSSISSGDDTGGSLDFDDSEERLSKKKPINTSDDPLKIRKSKTKSAPEKSQKRAENRIGQYKTFTFKKSNKSVTIDLYTGATTHCYFTSELLSELTMALNKISKERDCNVVLIRSTKESVFSYGLDYKSLISDKESVRKNKANELADRVRNFIKCLLDFPKILVAGIRGECAGLAVTMLPLFDIVIASDDARFSTSYSTLGCVAEAGFLLTVPHVSSYGLAGELLYASQKLTADEAFRRGLVSKLCWPEKYQDTIKALVMAVAQGSKQSLQATKSQLRFSIKQISSDEAIDSMVPELVEHWTSNECQNRFAQIE